MRPDRKESLFTTQGAHQTRCAPRRTLSRVPRVSHGFTLIEVMVSLTILVIGAIAVIRIFPPALGLVANSGYRSVGDRINSSELSTFNTTPQVVPDAIYDVAAAPVPTPYGSVTSISMPLDDSYPGAVVGNRNVNKSLPDGVTTPDIQNSALSHFRYVYSEKHVIRQRNVTVGGTDTQENFILTRYPYTGHVSVWEDDTIRGVKLRSNGVLDFSGAYNSSGTPFFDSSVGGNTKRPPTSARTTGGYVYYVTYRWREDLRGTTTNKSIQGVIDEPVYFPDNGGYGTLDSAQVLQAQRATGSPPRVVIFDQDVTVRVRHMLDADAVTVGTNPVPEPVDLPPSLPIGTPTLIESGLGYVPLPATANFATGKTISVDYQVSDWSLLLEDGQPTLNTLQQNVYPTPSIKEAVVQLPIKNINDDQANIIGSLYFVPELNNPNSMHYSTIDSIRQVNMTPDRTAPDKQQQSSTEVKPGAIQCVDPSGTATTYPGQTTTSLQNGRIAFDATQSSEEVTSPQTRVAYRTLDQWHHQVSVAAKSYLPFYQGLNEYPASPFNPRERWREFYFDTAGSTLVFHPSEAGKTVLVSYEYNTGSGAQIVHDSVVTIGEDISQNSVTFPGGAPGVLASISLPDGRIFGVGANATWLKAILSVKGASIQSRTAWTEGTHFEQSMLSAYRKQESSE